MDLVPMNKTSGGRLLQNPKNADCIIIKAKENGVSVIGLTRGRDTKFHHSEKLDKNEVMLAQFTEQTSAIKIRGDATIITAFTTVDTKDPEDK